jgi:hypothetical protein
VAEFKVPEAAVDAAWRADMLRRMDGRGRYRQVLEDAAPHIAAAALRQAAEDMWNLPRSDGRRPLGYVAWLRDRADQLDGRQPTEADMAERGPA